MIIGIDLGTSNSAVSYYDNGEAKIIPNDRGSRLTPSVLAYSASGELLVGEAAKNQEVINPQGTVSSVKRYMGSENAVSLHMHKMLPEEVSAEILKKMKRDAETYLAEPLSEAVITVPAYFTELQRRKTKRAGELAGLKVVQIINEPTAAALAYAHQSSSSCSMVYDLGGGTFDVTILHSDGDTFRVLSSCGDMQLGGIDFDRLIFKRIAKEFYRRSGHDFCADPILKQQLLMQVERAKIELSSRQSAQISFPFISGASKPIHLSYELKREELNEMIQPLIEKTISLCRQAVQDAGRKPDALILSGGSSRIPLVRDLLFAETGLRSEGRTNPDELVAMGAAVHADMIRDGKQSAFRDVTPLPLGVEIEGGDCVPLLKRNSPLPATAKRLFTTISDRQHAAEVHVLQGSGKRAVDNESLGRFVLSGLREARQGEPLIEVSFLVDEDGILHAAARDTESGAIQRIVMNNEQRDEDPELLEKRIARLQNRVRSDLEKQKSRLDTSFQREVEEILAAAEKADRGSSYKLRSSIKASLEVIAGELESRIRQGELRYG